MNWIILLKTNVGLWWGHDDPIDIHSFIILEHLVLNQQLDFTSNFNVSSSLSAYQTFHTGIKISILLLYCYLFLPPLISALLLKHLTQQSNEEKFFASCTLTPFLTSHMIEIFDGHMIILFLHEIHGAGKWNILIEGSVYISTSRNY